MQNKTTMIAVPMALLLALGPSFAQSGPDAARPPVLNAQAPDAQTPNAGESEDVQIGEGERLTVADFAYLAAVSALFDIEIARVAVARAQDAEVRAYAQRVLTDRERAIEELRSAVDAGDLVDELDEDNRRIVTALEGEQGADFDAEFIGLMVDAQRDAIDLYEEFAETATDERLRGFVSARIAALKSLVADAERIDDRLTPPR